MGNVTKNNFVLQPLQYFKIFFYFRINEEFHRCGKFGLGLALDMIPISTCDSDQAPDVYQDKVFTLFLVAKTMIHMIQSVYLFSRIQKLQMML